MGQVQLSLIDQKQPTNGLGGILDWAGENVSKIKTIYDEIKTFGKSDEVIVETPRAGSPEGKDVQNVDPKAVDRMAEVFNTAEKWIAQVKGLFNLGFPQDSPQPTSPVQHEIEPGAALPFGLSIGTAAIIGLLIFMLVKK